MKAAELRAQILAADDLPTEVVDVPEWGTKVTIRGLTAAEKDSYVSQVTDGQGNMKLSNASALLVSLTATDDEGERIFPNPADLGGKSALAVARLFNVSMELSGFTEGDVEEMVADFDGGQSDASSSS